MSEKKAKQARRELRAKGMDPFPSPERNPTDGPSRAQRRQRSGDNGAGFTKSPYKGEAGRKKRESAAKKRRAEEAKARKIRIAERKVDVEEAA